MMLIHSNLFEIMLIIQNYIYFQLYLLKGTFSIFSNKMVFMVLIFNNFGSEHVM